jgi:CRISPR-associated protein Cas1
VATRPGQATHGGQPKTKRQRAGSPPCDGVPAIPAGTTALGYRNPLGITIRASLRGIEGAAAAAFFEGYVLLFAPALGFENRRRRPPPDPVNACLSLGYTLLHAEASGVARTAGLDPMLGGFHEPSYGQDALASDLMEPLRPAVDAWVWAMFRSQTLRREHFRREEGACVLQHRAQALYYEAVHQKLRVWRRALRRYARLFAEMLPATEARLA